MKLNILITAGPTRERLDSVRYISNYSTGFFGYTIAQEAVNRGHKITLVSGPVHLPAPKKVKLLSVESAKELLSACKKNINKADVLIMSAAVSDFSPLKTSAKKIKRDKSLSLKLKKTPDILSNLARSKKGKVFVGFALETENVKKRAFAKLKKKNLDLIVANALSKKNMPFGSFKTTIMLCNKSGKCEILQKVSKSKAAKKLLDTIEEIC